MATATTSTYSTNLTTGKTWVRYMRRVDADNAPMPFGVGDTLRAQIRETPGGVTAATIVATITDREAGKWELLITDEFSAQIPPPRTFTAPRLYWFDVDILNPDGTVRELITNAKVFVKAGATEATT